ncbi:hypothetical protein BRC95_04995 [Halobacteriales archaeon QS_5_68_33]|nr:MAG: hypothetical protein BRC95_04995 [Halobacteriales archaeon QS_5_68_33]
MPCAGLASINSHKQARVYALREKAGFGRDETAAILNISPSTVDTHLQRAKEKLATAENLVQFVCMDAEELADPEFPGEEGTSDEGSVRAILSRSRKIPHRRPYPGASRWVWSSR